jgi:hypothetical protein
MSEALTIWTAARLPHMVSPDLFFWINGLRAGIRLAKKAAKVAPVLCNPTPDRRIQAVTIPAHELSADKSIKIGYLG